MLMSTCLNVTLSAMIFIKVASALIKIGYFDIFCKPAERRVVGNNPFFTSGLLEVSSHVSHKGFG